MYLYLIGAIGCVEVCLTLVQVCLMLMHLDFLEAGFFTGSDFFNSIDLT